MQKKIFFDYSDLKLYLIALNTIETMDKDTANRLYKIEFLLGELEELRLNYQDLKDEHYLLTHDNISIRQSVNVQKLILSRDYFKVEFSAGKQNEEQKQLI